MDSTRLSISDKVFDVVLISFGLHEFPQSQKIKILKESWRVLKDNGRMYIVEYDYNDEMLKKVLLWMHFVMFEPIHIFHFMKTPIDKLLSATGFYEDGVIKCFFSKIVIARKIAS